ncbi:MAG: type II toxin-antitoxin system HicB family antitoxin [Kiritimatiellia bacterium]|jgi:predicted HicB family RNase H-like nuclease
MNDCLEYKGYLGSVEVCLENRCFHGRIEFIEDLITFEAVAFDELEREFHLAVDDYLLTCKQVDKEPDKPFKGTFNVRVGSDIHRRAALSARKSGHSLNDFVKEAIERRVDEEKQVVHYEHTVRHTFAFERIEPAIFSRPAQNFGEHTWNRVARQN